MLTEKATYEELIQAMDEVWKYGQKGYNNPRVMRQFKHGAQEVWYRTNTPQSKHPALYYYTRRPDFNKLYGHGKKDFTHIGFAVLQGKDVKEDCESYCTTCNSHQTPVVIRGHAIRRYKERHHFQGTYEEARQKVLADLFVFNTIADPTDKTFYIFFDGGVFLCWIIDGVVRVNTYVMNSGLYPVQRMKSLQSEQGVNEIKKKYELI